MREAMTIKLGENERDNDKNKKEDLMGRIAWRETMTIKETKEIMGGLLGWSKMQCLHRARDKVIGRQNACDENGASFLQESDPGRQMGSPPKSPKGLFSAEELGVCKNAFGRTFWGKWPPNPQICSFLRKIGA